MVLLLIVVMDENLCIDEIRLWNVKTLKDFLRKRGLKTAGRKDELVALVFAAMRLPQLCPTTLIDHTPESEKIKKYESLLVVPSGKLPDPQKLEAGWKSESESVSMWPPTMAFDIGTYLASTDNIPLRTRLMSDYKEGKAYSYFASGWLKEIQYHGITQDSPYCFLRTECRPSQRINNIPWKVWVLLVKKSGVIQSGYCTCFAGFGGTCNHIAALLFKIDFAWRMGLTNLACTSKECQWSAFGSKHKIEPKQISEMSIFKPQFSKSKVEGINPSIRQLFSPSSTRSTSSRKETNLDNIITKLYPDFQTACAFEYVWPPDQAVNQLPPECDLNVSHFEEVPYVETPTAISTLADNASTIEEFFATLPTYSSETVSELERLTRGQALNTLWFEQRKGRITGSVAHSVMTRSRRLMANEVVDNTALLRRLLGYTQLNPNLPALKYGREMEDEAKRAYIQFMRASGHNLDVRDCGLFVQPDQVYLGASPDGLVYCKCCKRGVLEIKCPYSISHTYPSSDNVSYIEKTDKGSTLQKSHPYYTQVQLQMGVTDTKWCDFFVYSRHGSLRIRVPFDEERWTEIRAASTFFFMNHMAKELVKQTLPANSVPETTDEEFLG